MWRLGSVASWGAIQNRAALPGAFLKRRAAQFTPSIQATIPSAFGLFYAPWLFDRSLVLAGGVTIIATLLLFLSFAGA